MNLIEKPLIAFDTSSEYLSIALQAAGRRFTFHAAKPRKHANELLDRCDELLIEAGMAKSDLAGVVVGRGPGSFTGVRIAIAAAQGMAFGLDVPVMVVSSLRAMALAYQQESGRQRVLAAFDARMGQVYAGLFDYSEDPAGELLGNEQVCNPEEFDAPGLESIQCAVGEGAVVYAGQLPLPADAQCVPGTPTAAALLDIAQTANADDWVPASQAQPTYLRNKVTHN